MFTIVELALSLGVLATLITALSACVCGCKNSNQKSELVGMAGVVKIRLDEEVPSPTPTTPASIKRASTQNSQRSLPEIPHPVGRHDSGDTASEIYATVNLDEGNKPVSTSAARENPYEHEYAKLQNENHNVAVEITLGRVSDDEIQIEDRETAPPAAESAPLPAAVAISGQLPSSQELPYITPPSPRPPAHFSGDSTDSAKGYTSISVREPLSNIRAQSAKPPAHYATVSDDSDEMYAAIEEASVGEGSDTYAQIVPERRRGPPRGHPDGPPDGSVTGPLTTPPAGPSPGLPAGPSATDHARRSAPPEIGVPSVITTHSRQASMSSCSNSTGASGSPKPEKRQANSPLPPPPAARASQAAQRHHRMSSTGDLHFNHDKLRRSLNEKHQRNNSCVSSSDFYGCNYPVDKHRFSSGDLMRPLVAKELNFDLDQKENAPDNLYNSIEGPGYSDYSSAEPNTSITSEHRDTESPSRNVEEMYAKVMKRAKAKEEALRTSKESSCDVQGTNPKYRGDDPGYETIDRKQSANHGYETIARKERKGSSQDPGYETVKDVNTTGHSSSFVNNNSFKVNHLSVDSGPNSILSSDAGYEHISKADNNTSDSDPNYEVLRNEPPTPPYATVAPSYRVQPTYSTVNKKTGKNWSRNNNDESTLEPNYESMCQEPEYTTGSESDPNYESVRPKHADYERVSQHPNYESLPSKDSKYEDSYFETFGRSDMRSKDSKYDSVRSKMDPNYESVKYFELSKKDPPYEKVSDAAATTAGLGRSDSAAGYEKINVPNNRNSKSGNNVSGEGTVSDYFQV